MRRERGPRNKSWCQDFISFYFIFLRVIPPYLSTTVLSSFISHGCCCFIILQPIMYCIIMSPSEYTVIENTFFAPLYVSLFQNVCLYMSVCMRLINVICRCLTMIYSQYYLLLTKSRLLQSSSLVLICQVATANNPTLPQTRP